MLLRVINDVAVFRVIQQPHHVAFICQFPESTHAIQILNEYLMEDSRIQLIDGMKNFMRQKHDQSIELGLTVMHNGYLSSDGFERDSVLFVQCSAWDALSALNRCT